MAFIKRAPAQHPQATMVEAAGLRWLAQAAQDGGAPVVRVLAAEPGQLVLEELPQASPDAAAARRFGAALARTHRWLAAAGTEAPGVAFGTLPPEHPEQTPACFGPAERPLALGTGVHASWGRFTARERLDPVLQALRPRLSASEAELLDAAREQIDSGALDDSEPPALIHGDLWAGNVLWTPETPEAPDDAGQANAAPAKPGQVEAVLIDPAAHAGHRETDIALLHLFGLPQLEAVIDGYQREHPLRTGWQDRIPLHQFFCLTVHWLLFGQSYRDPTLRAADAVLSLSAGS